MARSLTIEVYSVTRQPPFSKDFGLCDQIRRAAGSVMHNIAEGFDGARTPSSSSFFAIRSDRHRKYKANSTWLSIRNTSTRNHSSLSTNSPNPPNQK